MRFSDCRRHRGFIYVYIFLSQTSFSFASNNRYQEVASIPLRIARTLRCIFVHTRGARHVRAVLLLLLRVITAECIYVVTSQTTNHICECVLCVGTWRCENESIFRKVDDVVYMLFVIAIYIHLRRVHHLIMF